MTSESRTSRAREILSNLAAGVKRQKGKIMAGIRTVEGRIKPEVKVGIGGTGLALVAIACWTISSLSPDANRYDGPPVPGSGDTGPTTGEVIPDAQATIRLAEGVPSETNDWFLGSPLPAETSTATATLTLIPENGAGGPVFSADIGEFLRQRLTMNLSLPGCEQSGNQSPDRADWVSEPAAVIETKGGDIQGLYDILRPELPYGASIELCVSSEGWFFLVSGGIDHVPYWNQILNQDGDWVFADHPNRIPLDDEGNILPWRMMRLPGDAFTGWKTLIVNGEPVLTTVDGDDNPVAYFNPVTGEMVFLFTPTPAPPTPEPTPTEKPTAAPTAKPTEVLPLPTAVPPEPTATEDLAPPNLPTPEGLPWPEGWSPPPGWPEDTVYRGNNSIRLYRWISPGSIENPMPGFENTGWTRVTDCRTDPDCPFVSGGVDKGNGLSVAESIALARQIAGDPNVRIRIIYIGDPNSDSKYNPYHVVDIRVQILNN